MRFILFCISFLAIVLLTSCTKDKGRLPPTDCSLLNTTFSVTIQPIINARCATSGCHVPSGGNNIPFTSYEEIKAKVGVNSNPLKQQVDSRTMPPAGSPPLSDDEIAEIDCWLEAGALNN